MEDTGIVGCEPHERQVTRRYGRRLAVAIGAYSVVTVAAGLLLDRDLPRALQVVIALAPMVPALGIPFAVVRLLRETDELQRRILLEALAAAFAAGSLLTFGYGWLQLAGAPEASWFLVWPVYAACWAVATAVAQHHYGRA